MQQFVSFHAIQLFDRRPTHPVGPITKGTNVRSNGPRRRSGRRTSALPWTGARAAAKCFRFGPSVRVMAIAVLIFVAMSDLSFAGETRSSSDRATLNVGLNGYDAFIAEASRRFDIPSLWIRAIMRAESAGDVRAVSDKGALGLMQVMPETYAELSARHHLGADIFDPRDNILAGTAYMREMRDRFGSPGFLAAYNAGPARYDEYLTNGRPLPEETRRYVADLAPRIGAPEPELASAIETETPSWTNAPLFVRRDGGQPTTERPSIISQADDHAAEPRTSSELQSQRTPTTSKSPIRARSNGLFVTRSNPGT